MDSAEHVEWQAEVGFIKEWKPTWAVLLGQSGFLDRLTVTFGRQALAFSVELPEVFDDRFAEEIRAVEHQQMEGTIDGLGLWNE